MFKHDLIQLVNCKMLNDSSTFIRSYFICEKCRTVGSLTKLYIATLAKVCNSEAYRFVKGSYSGTVTHEMRDSLE